MNEWIHIPLYFNFRFVRLDLPYEIFDDQWNYEYSRTGFWQKILSGLFKKRISLYDSVINIPSYDPGTFGITMFTMHSPQYRNDKILYSINKIIRNRLKIKAGKYVYEPYIIDDIIEKFNKHEPTVDNGCIKDLVRMVNYCERRIFEWHCNHTSDKKWDNLRSDFLTDGFIMKKLRREGIPPHHMSYDLIETERLLIQTKRELKNYKNDNLSNMLRRHETGVK